MEDRVEPVDVSLQESLLGETCSPHGEDKASSETTKIELKALLKLSAPLMVQLASQYAIILINQYFIGHLGPAQLAAAAIGNTWFNFCWYFLLGTSTALDTLGSQAHGEGNPNGVISCCVSAISVLSLLCIPVSAAMFFAEPVAQKVFFQTPEAGELVGTFCKGLLPGLLPLVWSIAVLKAMQVQNHVWAPANMTVITAILSIPINMVLVRYYSFWGAALATSVARTLLLILLCGWLVVLSRGSPTSQEQNSKPQKTDDKSQVTWASAIAAARHGVTPKVLARFLALGLPGGVMMGVDAASFDVTTVMASVLGYGLRFLPALSLGPNRPEATYWRSSVWLSSELNFGSLLVPVLVLSKEGCNNNKDIIGQAQVDAHSILLTFCVFIYMSFPFGVSTAATIRVGNMVGANRPSEARLAGYMAVALGCAFTTLEALGIMVFKKQIGPLFVDDANVSREVASVAPICAGYQVTDGIYGVASGVLKGLGRQASLMVYNILGFWVVGFTTGYLLTFKFGYGLAGVWWGIFWGITTTGAVCLPIATNISCLEVHAEWIAGELLSSQQIFATVVMCAATLCSVSMLRVDWSKEAQKAQQESLAIQNDSQHSLDHHVFSDLEQAANGDEGAAAESTRGGTSAEQPSTPLPMSRRRSSSQAISPRISIQPFGTPGQRHSIGSFGSPSRMTRAFQNRHQSAS